MRRAETKKEGVVVSRFPVLLEMGRFETTRVRLQAKKVIGHAQRILGERAN